PEVSAFVVGAIQVVASVIYVTVEGKFGRKVWLMISSAIAFFNLLIFGFYFYLIDERTISEREFGWLPVTCLVGYILGFTFGLGPMPFIVAAEILTTETKNLALGLASTTNSLFSFLMSRFYQDLTNMLKSYGVFWFFSSLALATFIFVPICMYETRGKPIL